MCIMPYKTSWVERGNIHSALQTPITVSQAYTHYTVTREHAGHVWGERERVVPVEQITITM